MTSSIACIVRKQVYSVWAETHAAMQRSGPQCQLLVITLLLPQLKWGATVLNPKSDMEGISYFQ